MAVLISSTSIARGVIGVTDAPGVSFATPPTARLIESIAFLSAPPGPGPPSAEVYRLFRAILFLMSFAIFRSCTVVMTRSSIPAPLFRTPILAAHAPNCSRMAAMNRFASTKMVMMTKVKKKKTVVTSREQFTASLGASAASHRTSRYISLKKYIQLPVYVTKSATYALRKSRKLLYSLRAIVSLNGGIVSPYRDTPRHE